MAATAATMEAHNASTEIKVEMMKRCRFLLDSRSDSSCILDISA